MNNFKNSFFKEFKNDYYKHCNELINSEEFKKLKQFLNINKFEDVLSYDDYNKILRIDM